MLLVDVLEARFIRWQLLLFCSAHQGGLGQRSALAFHGEWTCSQCLAFTGAAKMIAFRSLRCRRDKVALESAHPEGRNGIPLGILCIRWGDICELVVYQQSLVKRRGSEVAVCGSVCAPGEVVLINKFKACLPLRVCAAVAQPLAVGTHRCWSRACQELLLGQLSLHLIRSHLQSVSGVRNSCP